MANPILKSTDFADEYKISTDNFSGIDAYIIQYERHYLLRLLGSDLFDLFIADLSGDPSVPGSARFLDIFNEFHSDENGTLRDSEGMKRMLIQFVYFHYVRDQNFQNSKTGVVRNVNSNSTALPYNGYNLIESYNQGIRNYDTIQWFIRDNDSDYPEENIQPLLFISGI